MANLIFDFDGTLADSFAIAVHIMHDLTHQSEAMPANEIQRLRGMGMVQVMKELRIRPWKIPFLVALGRRQMRTHMKDVKAFKGMPEAIKKLAKQHDVYMMSSNSLQNISLFLRSHQLEDSFVRLYGGVGVLGKAHVLRKVMSQNRLDPAQTIYIGDEVRDIVASQRAGVRVVAVSWGFNNAAILEAHNPDALVASVPELQTVIRSLTQ